MLARSWFNHSMNYRSVIIHGLASRVTDPDQKWDAMIALMEHVAKGRAAGSRDANKREFAATEILRIPLTEVSLKHREGPPSVDEEDENSPFWDGVMPITTMFGPVIAACELPLSWLPRRLFTGRRVAWPLKQAPQGRLPTPYPERSRRSLSWDSLRSVRRALRHWSDWLRGWWK